MKYIKFDENGKAFEAPAKLKTEAGTIFGYNNEKNEKRLLADGWLKYDGKAPLNRLKLENGEIIEIAQQTQVTKPKTVFTKLQIRRALRKLGKEAALDKLIQTNPEFYKDWHDAQEIDFNDEMITSAVNKGVITTEFLNELKKELK